MSDTTTTTDPKQLLAEDDPKCWLICKAGRGWYRPNAQGYTPFVREAGRYTLDEATRHAHPNGPDGPRDGITIHHISTLSEPVAPDPSPEVLALRAERDRLREALEFYADKAFDGYDVSITDYGLSTELGEIIKDGGDRARAALGEKNDE